VRSFERSRAIPLKPDTTASQGWESLGRAWVESRKTNRAAPINPLMNRYAHVLGTGFVL